MSLSRKLHHEVCLLTFFGEDIALRLVDTILGCCVWCDIISRLCFFHSGIVSVNTTLFLINNNILLIGHMFWCMIHHP
jgi:hypothetical protein